MFQPIHTHDSRFCLSGCRHVGGCGPACSIGCEFVFCHTYLDTHITTTHTTTAATR